MEAAGYDPEVCLAVCIPRAQEETAGENEVQEEDTEVDTTLMSYGFEYVDGRQESLPRAELADADDSDGTFPITFSNEIVLFAFPAQI